MGGQEAERCEREQAMFGAPQIFALFEAQIEGRGAWQKVRR